MPSFLKDKADRLSAAPGPYLHSGQSASKILLGISAALLPLILGSVIFLGWNALRIYAVAIGTGLLFEYLFELLTEQRNRVHDGSTILIAVLFSFLMPANLPVKAVMIGIFIAVVLAKELFGGLGQNLFHPALAGYASVVAFFPDFFQRDPQLLGTVNIFFILISGAIVMFKKWVRWEHALFYFGLSLLGIQTLEFSGFLLLIALFFMTDPASSPIAFEGRVLFSALAGLLTAAFSFSMNIGQAAVSSVLISNALVPLIDHFVYLSTQK